MLIWTYSHYQVLIFISYRGIIIVKCWNCNETCLNFASLYVCQSTISLLVLIPWNRCGGPGGVTGGSSRFLLKRGAIIKSYVWLGEKSRHPATGRGICVRFDAFVRRAEAQCRIFLSSARSQSGHTLAPPENVTFPPQAHLPVFFILLEKWLE